MKRLFFSLISVAVLLSCATVPITGRRSLNLIPAATLNSMSFQQYDEFIGSHKLTTDKDNTQLVKRVGLNIQKAVEDYFTLQGMADQLNDYQWEFNLVESEEVNAWCMPGGKVVVYTGILPYTKDETGLAVVMGHEIAHAIAGHGNERMSQGLIANMGGMALSKALEEKPEETRNLWMTAYGVGAQFGVLLPYSRLHENEADHLGLIFMALAGYDPAQAVVFWQRMSSGKNQSIPEFMSTHPADETRIKNLQALLPEAMQYYRK